MSDNRIAPGIGGDRFVGKVAVVTGGASGIGEATVKALHARGAHVVVGDLNEQRGRVLQTGLGDRVSFLPCDVTLEEDVAHLVEHAIDRFGQLDIGLNVAGGGRGGGTIRTTDRRAWQDTLDLCLTGVFFAVKHEAEQMIRQGRGGAIVNVASMNAQIPVYGVGAYCCAKAGVEMLTKVAALELGEYWIRVNAVSPGHVATPGTEQTPPAMRSAYLEQTPLSRIGQPEEVAAALLFLASDDARNISGVSLLVDGGFCTTTHFDLRPYFPNLDSEAHSEHQRTG